MDPTPVVTVFLRNRDDVLLLRRSDAAGSYRGRWAAVAGHVNCRDGTEREPITAAREEIAEETGLEEACTLVREGDPFSLHDPAADRTWQVHPFLFDCDQRTVELNEESVDHEWVPPTAILSRTVVPALWTSYDHVRPTVETVEGDTTHGSAYISIRALDVLRDRAGELAAAGSQAEGELVALARRLLDARPSMVALQNRVNRAMADAADLTPHSIHESAQRTIDRALDADADAARHAAEYVDDAHVLTLSRSGTVHEALVSGSPRTVTVLESAPGREGREVAEALDEAGLDVTLVPDAAVAHVLASGDVDVVLVGADNMLADGRVVNKVGTRTTAVAASQAGVPLYVVAARDKIAPGTDLELESAAELFAAEADVAVGVDGPLFDVTPPEMVSGVITEAGVLDSEGVAGASKAHRELSNWQKSTE